MYELHKRTESKKRKIVFLPSFMVYMNWERREISRVTVFDIRSLQQFWKVQETEVILLIKRKTM